MLELLVLLPITKQVCTGASQTTEVHVSLHVYRAASKLTQLLVLLLIQK